MQFEIRFSNGFWKLFDSRNYRDVAKFDSQKEAQQALGRRGRK